MTDQQLLEAGERLYNAFLGSNFTFLELAGLAAARERRTAWTELGQNLKLAVFRLVVLSGPELPAPPQPIDPQVDPSHSAASPLHTTPADSIATATPANGTESATPATATETSLPAVDPEDSGEGTIS